MTSVQEMEVRPTAIDHLSLLISTPDLAGEARRLGCSHILSDGIATPLNTEV